MWLIIQVPSTKLKYSTFITFFFFAIWYEVSTATTVIFSQTCGSVALHIKYLQGRIIFYFDGIIIIITFLQHSCMAKKKN